MAPVSDIDVGLAGMLSAAVELRQADGGTVVVGADELPARWSVVHVDRWAADGEQLGPFTVTAPDEPPWTIRVDWHSGDDVIHLGGGWAMPYDIAVDILTSVGPMDDRTPVHLTVQLCWVEATQRLEVKDLHLRPPPDANYGITPTMLRQLPLVAITSNFAFGQLVYLSEINGETVGAVLQPDPEDVAEGPTIASLTMVAGIYRAALIANVPPVKAVVETFDMTRAKAADWIKRARYAGLIELDEEWRPKRTDARARPAAAVGTAHDATIETSINPRRHAERLRTGE